MDTFSNRFHKALELRNMKQAEIVEITGIGKSSISTYLSGEYEPKQRNIYKIAKALNVSESWLMGYSDEMERQDYTPPKTIAAHATEDLTEEEQEKVREYIQFLKMKRGQ